MSVCSPSQDIAARNQAVRTIANRNAALLKPLANWRMGPKCNFTAVGSALQMDRISA